MALAARIEKRDTRVIVVMGDGEINEGSVWEAALCAGKHKLANLTAVIDYNKIQSAGPTRDIQDLEPLLDKWRAFNFAAVEVDGHDVEALREAFRAAAALARPAERNHLSHRQGQGHRRSRRTTPIGTTSRKSPTTWWPSSTRPWSKPMRATCLNMVYDLAKRDKRVVFIGSDLSPGLLAGMQQEMPERWYMEGITEANVIGMAAGFAMEGYIPYVNTIATFITRRCYEQVAVDLCLHDLPVRLIANGGGLVYAPLGPTHLAIEDIAIMRALPNMTVTAVCDAKEMVRLMNGTLDWPHPIYIRLAKGGDPVVSRDENGFAIGKAIPMRRARSRRSIVLLATGVMTTNSLAAAEILGERRPSMSRSCISIPSSRWTKRRCSNSPTTPNWW